MKRPHSALSQAVRGSESDRGQSFTFDTALSEAPLALLAAARTTGRPYHRRPPLSQPRGKEIGVGLAFCCLPEWRVVALDAASGEVETEAVNGTYDFFSKRMPRVPRTEVEGVKNILVEIGAAQRDPAEFFDMSLIDEIEREGFVQKLYGS